MVTHVGFGDTGSCLGSDQPRPQPVAKSLWLARLSGQAAARKAGSLLSPPKAAVGKLCTQLLCAKLSLFDFFFSSLLFALRLFLTVGSGGKKERKKEKKNPFTMPYSGSIGSGVDEERS